MKTMTKSAWVLAALALCAAGQQALAAGDAPAATAAQAFLKPKKGGVVGNSWPSEMVVINATTLRITTRKLFVGDAAEINKPGTTAYQALQSVADLASLRAATEATALGYPAFKVVSFRNLSQARETRANSRVANNEGAYTFAPGKYDQSIELAIELVATLLPAYPAEPNPDVLDCAAVIEGQKAKAAAAPATGDAPK